MNLKSNRIKAGYTQKALADAIRVAPSTVCMYEKGVRQVPVRLVPKIAATLGCTIDDLFGGEEKTNA